MKFYLSEDYVIEISPEIANNIIIVNESKFEYKGNTYLIMPIEFNINDVYFLLHKIIKDNPNKKIFIQKFEPLTNNFYVMYYAVEL